jgi:hypothetical protein
MNVYIGWDPREQEAYDVATYSLKRRASIDVGVHALKLDELRASGLLTRPVERKQDGKLWCPISQAPMSTEFAISRFCVPFLQRGGWAVFTDCDVLWNCDVAELFGEAKSEFAVQVVKHNQIANPNVLKADGQVQTVYSRKNWSSVILWNCEHPANQKLTRSMLNSLPGRDLHAFCWLKDDEIGPLPPEWNVLVEPAEPKLLHYTLGGPWFPGYENCAYSSEWVREQHEMQKGRTLVRRI